MIVRQFLQWVRTAPAPERAEATAALARAWLHSDLSADDRAAFEGAMLMLLDDVSPLVRAALAETLAPSPRAPEAVILALAADQPEIAAIVARRSPLLRDADLVDMAACCDGAVQNAIAGRDPLPRTVAAALAEVGSIDAVLILIGNAGADIPAFSLARIAERFGGVPAVREALLARADLPAQIRQALMVQLSRSLAAFAVERGWLDRDRAERVAREACVRGTVALAAGRPSGQLRALVRHLRETRQLNAGLILRALLSGNLALFEHALAELADLPLARVVALIEDRRSAGARALLARAGLPASTLPMFMAALAAVRERGSAGAAPRARLERGTVERVLALYGETRAPEIDPVTTALRRLASEAAREEARRFCRDLAA